jgi:ribosomal-protein-alanine N-acetyltransferase
VEVFFLKETAKCPFFPDPSGAGLGFMEPSDAGRFSEWEQGRRPYPWSEKQFLETIHSTSMRTLVWREQGEPIGFASIQIAADEVYLLNIMVAPDLQGKGRGKVLIEKILAWSGLAGARRVILDVDPDNSSARRIYEKSGFSVKARRVHAYPRGEPSFVMVKEL